MNMIAHSWPIVPLAPALLLLAAAAVSDLRARRIPNWITLSLALGGIARAALGHIGSPGGSGWIASTGGVALGVVLLYLPFALGQLGAGDVKLVAGAGAWLGPEGVVQLVLASAVAGGALALIIYFRASPATR